MTKKRTSNMQLESLQLTFRVIERADFLADNNALDTEIECPSCQNTMDLYSVSESPYYSCDDCNFCLYTKW
jgi:transposase-like protein